MSKLPVYQMEVFISYRYLTENERNSKGDRATIQAIGNNQKMDILNSAVTRGVWIKDDDSLVEIFFPAHCIRRIRITKLSKTKKEAK